MQLFMRNGLVIKESLSLNWLWFLLQFCSVISMWNLLEFAILQFSHNAQQFWLIWKIIEIQSLKFLTNLWKWFLSMNYELYNSNHLYDVWTIVFVKQYQFFYFINYQKIFLKSTKLWHTVLYIKIRNAPKKQNWNYFSVVECTLPNMSIVYRKSIRDMSVRTYVCIRNCIRVYKLLNAVYVLSLFCSYWSQHKALFNSIRITKPIKYL